MQSAEIARRFLAYFEAQGHAIVPSASLVADDPTLLFVVAGMQPFKPYLLGQRTPPSRRVADVQKCVRTLDIEEVGKTTRHATFFQMLGNWSFGDYFKEEAIPFAWELLTRSERDGGFGFPESKLWATVLHGDDEAHAIWRRKVGVPDSRIQRRGLNDNYWHMGVPGPGGPCSEIYYDRGPAYGREGGPEADEDRYLEIWNLVFMQDQLSAVRKKDDFDVEGPLPHRNVDTGMGLERMASLLQGVENIYEIDTTYRILARAAELTEQEYGSDRRADVALRVVADHVRSAVMLISDGVLPSNDGRGYVLRRIIRRAVLAARRLGTETAVTPALTETTAAVMGEAYPNLREEMGVVQSVLEREEAGFDRTLRTGLTLLEGTLDEVRGAGATVLPGEAAFRLHDTHGFPIELTEELAAEAGVSVDRAAYDDRMAEQRSRARQAARAPNAADEACYRQLLEHEHRGGEQCQERAGELGHGGHSGVGVHEWAGGAVPLETARAVSMRSGASFLRISSSVQRLVGAEMLMAPTGCPPSPITGAATVRSLR